MRLVVMGVSGCGKSSLGAALATALALPFTDADDLHPAANRAKMAAGQPLTDADRWPWLQAVGAVLAGGAGVVACSALRRSYRDRLRDTAGPVQFLHLVAPREVIVERLAARRGHFMPLALLDSQLATLEPLAPGEGWTLNVNGPQEANLATALQLLRAARSNFQIDRG
jgi:carbohydrate kinase (thermoresistant glucokinase family)